MHQISQLQFHRLPFWKYLDRHDNYLLKILWYFIRRILKYKTIRNLGKDGLVCFIVSAVTQGYVHKSHIWRVLIYSFITVPSITCWMFWVVRMLEILLFLTLMTYIEYNSENSLISLQNHWTKCHQLESPLKQMLEKRGQYVCSLSMSCWHCWLANNTEYSVFLLYRPIDDSWNISPQLGSPQPQKTHKKKTPKHHKKIILAVG